MPRKGPATRRQLVTDPVYGSPLVTALVNKVLRSGKRSLAERIVYGALDGAKDKTGNDPVVTLKRALDNVKPTLEVRSRRVGGATYQVPVEVRASRSTTLALRWIVAYSRQRREKTMTERLMNELLDASNGLGQSVKRREDTHKMAESNKAFAHYRWERACCLETGATIAAKRQAVVSNERTGNEARGHPDRRGTRQGPQHRDHGAYRRGQNDHYRADPFLHRHQLQDRRGP
jgi:small subunit ribosomal protein S7